MREERVAHACGDRGDRRGADRPDPARTRVGDMAPDRTNDEVGERQRGKYDPDLVGPQAAAPEEKGEERQQTSDGDSDHREQPGQ